MAKQIYLDLNKYIELSKMWHKISNDESGILQFIDEKKRDGELIFPISSSHIIELAKNSNFERRKRLAETMWHFSNGLVFINHVEILNFEIDRAIETVFDIEKKADSIDLLHKNPLKAFAPLDDIANNLKVSNETIKGLSDLFQEQEGWIGFVASYYDESRKIALDKIYKDNKRITNSINNNRAILNNESEDLMKRANMAMLMLDTQDRVSERLKKFGLSMNDIKELGIDKITNFYLSIPSFDIEFQMKMQSFKNKGKDSEENDVFDIGFLSTAICYFDVVVTEKYWTDITRQAKLHIKYNTLIETDLQSLNSINSTN